MGEKLLAVCAFIVTAFAIPYIVTMIMNDSAKWSESQIEELSSGRQVCINDNGEYRIIDVEEYIVYSLAGQADMSWNEEMLKTMAVIMRTSIYYQMEEQTQNTDSNFVDESGIAEIRYTKQELKALWGNKYEENLQRVTQAVRETGEVVMRYEDSLIMPVYHEVSMGTTVDSSEVYGVEIPYLKAVESEMDVESSDFSTMATYSKVRLTKEFANEEDYYEDDDTDTSEDTATKPASSYNPDEINVAETTDSGMVVWVNVCGKKIKGSTFADVLGLGSLFFYIEKDENEYNIITMGKGSQVGLSLYGAGAMAQSGSSYEDILKYYYTGITVSKEK